MTSTKPPTPARLSSISTSLLTSILELSQQNSLELTVNPATKSKILKNLLTLRDGLIQTGIDDQDPILVGLRNQYQRIVGLVRGVGGMETEIQGIDLSLPASKPLTTTTTTTTAAAAAARTEEPLIDVEGTELEPASSSVTSNHHQTHNIQSNSQSSMTIDIPSTTRTRSRKAIEEDEELMRSENEQVQRIQQVLLDDQDRTLDELSNAISRQRDLSLHISSELEVQENLLDELDQDLDFTSNRLTRANKRMDNLFKKIAKDGACWTIFGLVAILLFLIVLLK